VSEQQQSASTKCNICNTARLISQTAQSRSLRILSEQACIIKPDTLVRSLFVSVTMKVYSSTCDFVSVTMKVSSSTCDFVSVTMKVSSSTCDFVSVTMKVSSSTCDFVSVIMKVSSST